MLSADDDGGFDVANHGCRVIEAEEFVVEGCEMGG